MSTESFAELGYALIPAAIADEDCVEAIQQVEHLALTSTSAGSRNLLALFWCRELAAALKSSTALVALLPAKAVAVQCTLFEKTAEMNWGVAVHQDLSIPVRERVSGLGFTGWAQKEGVLYTQPPPEVLANVVAIRIHLDPCPAHAGPLRVVPGSHSNGRLSNSEITRFCVQRGEVECLADRGDALVMRPLLLHASSRAAGNDKRRVLHFLFGPRDLPYGLTWHEAV